MSYTMRARYLDKFGAEKSLKIQSGCELNKFLKFVMIIIGGFCDRIYIYTYMGIIKVADFLSQNITLKVQNTYQVKRK